MTLIAVLEDDVWRIAEMRRALKLLVDCELLLFESAHEMLSWLRLHPGRAHVLSLDCDLDAPALRGENPGSGQDVSSFLAGQPHRYPVVVHSSNAMRAPAMHMELAFAGHDHVFLRPFRDAKSWATDISEALERAANS